METRYTLMCQTTDGVEAWDTEMGAFETIEAAQAAIPAAMLEWDEQITDAFDAHETPASECRWYVWDHETRETVA